MSDKEKSSVINKEGVVLDTAKEVEEVVDTNDKNDNVSDTAANKPQEVNSDDKATKKSQKDAKQSSKQAKSKKKNANKKPNFFVRCGRKIKEVFSELKKVTWPSFKTVMKQLGIVSLVVVSFLVILTLMDWGLAELLSLLTSIGK